MDLIGNNVCSINGVFCQSSPEDIVQRITWTSTGNGYAMNSGLSASGSFSASEQDLNLKAEDMTNRIYDGYIPQICLMSNERGSKFTATVNWGDGTEETYESASIYYRKTYIGDDEEHELYSSASESTEVMIFSPMLDDSLQGAVQSAYPTINSVKRLCDWWYCTEDGERYRGIPNHKYADDAQYDIVVTITGANVTTFRIATMPDIGWPILELPYLTSLTYYHLYNRSSIPFSNFTYLSELTTLVLNAMNSDLTSIPDSLFNMDSLTSLTIYDMPTASGHDWWEELNMGRIKNLTKLQSLTLRGMYQYYYPEELQDLPLTSVVFGTNNSYSTYPNRTTDFSKVTKFTSSSSTISITEGTTWNSDRTADAQAEEEIYSNYLGELTQDVSRVSFRSTGYVAANFRSSTYVNMEYPEIPEWFDRFYVESAFFGEKHFSGQTQTDSLTQRIYEATIKHPMSSTEDGHRNPWYSQNISAASANYDNKRPSGTLQAPDGFVEGENNGNPASPLEMIYVLTHNYGQTWSIMAETSTTSTLSLSSDKANKYRIITNKEGCHIIASPDAEVLGAVSSIEYFETYEDLIKYVEKNNIDILNKDGLDYK